MSEIGNSAEVAVEHVEPNGLDGGFGVREDPTGGWVVLKDDHEIGGAPTREEALELAAELGPGGRLAEGGR